ncbi:hypothetical protein GmHk_04G010485 [Glycine max]|nr:hypothetical protein GmHk_04G010485 [Glycine max]
MSTLARSSLRSSSTSSSTSTRSPMAATILRIFSMSHATNGIKPRSRVISSPKYLGTISAPSSQDNSSSTLSKLDIFFSRPTHASKNHGFIPSGMSMYADDWDQTCPELAFSTFRLCLGIRMSLRRTIAYDGAGAL